MDMEFEATAAFLEPARREAMGTSRHNACQPTALMQRLHPVTGSRGLAPGAGEAGPPQLRAGMSSTECRRSPLRLNRDIVRTPERASTAPVPKNCIPAVGGVFCLRPSGMLR